MYGNKCCYFSSRNLKKQQYRGGRGGEGCKNLKSNVVFRESSDGELKVIFTGRTNDDLRKKRKILCGCFQRKRKRSTVTELTFYYKLLG